MKALSTRFRGWHVVAVLVLAFASLPLMPARRGKAQAPTTTYTIIDLGTLGGTESVAYGINNCAQVVGDASLSGASPKHPFIWRDANNDGDSDPGEMQDLGTFAGGSGTASAINSSAYVAGDSVAVDPRAFRWHDPGPLESLGVLPGDVISLAYDINDSNQIVGMSENEFLTDRAFIWNQSGGMQPLPILNSVDPMWAYGINNSGAVVGIATNLHAFVHTGATNIDLGTFGGNLSIAYEISDDNRIVGYAETTSPDANVPRRAFIWHDDNGNNQRDLLPVDEMKNLGTLGGTRSVAYDINSTAYVVGYADISSGADPRRAFIWHDDNGNGSNDSGEMKDLNTLIPPVDAANWTLQEARSINDGGQIVGFGTKTGSGQVHAFLLTPTGYTPPPCATPTPSVTVAVSPSAVAEDAASNLVYTFTRTGSTASPLTVNFSVGGDAIFNTDYTQTGATTFNSTSGTVTIGAGNLTATVTVDPNADTGVESDENAILTVTSGSGYGIGSPSAATGTITNDDTSVNVTVSPSVAEDGATNLTYTFTRTGVTSGALTVNFSVGGTATFNTDYTQSGATTFNSSSGTVSFSEVETAKSVTIDPATDALDEPNETVDLTVASGAGYVVGAPNSASGTINDDDGPPSFSINDVTIAEGNSGTTAFTFTVTKTGATVFSSTVSFATANGTAVAEEDYTATSGTLNFDPGEASETITVLVKGDLSVEADETFFVNLSAATNATISDNQGLGTISNDDTDVTVAVSPSSVTEDGATNLVYTFTRNGVTSGALTVNFSISGDAATNDYTTAANGTVNFSAGSPTATVTIDPTPDTTVEPDETVILTVTPGSGYNVASPSTATGTITNDDTDVTVAVLPVSVAESSSSNLVFTFTRNGVISGALTVNFSITGTASASDYTSSATGTVNFTAGSPTATVTIDPTPDGTVEPDETVTLTLNSGSGYNVASPNAATGTITDAPLIFNEENTNNAIALNSVTFVRGPFRVFDDHNFSADQHTRIILLTSNLGLSQPDSSLLSVQASGFDLPVENVGAFTGVPGLDASYIVVRLPDNLPPGDLQLTVTLRGATSIARIFSIVQ